ncbi:hypothetical protein [Chimaeribacter californicus]|uniref:hypothetical protein n=1 Tax=Chimaeribacter californicus TaxID=2060067 RepID=UPI0011AF8954|nr:hypothetical protein [Chimaeribacter californicus]
MAKIIIRIISLLGAIIAFFCAWKYQTYTWYFTALAFLITFIGTFVVNKSSSTGHTVTQKGGAFSHNNQSVNIGAPSAKDKNK